MVKTAEAHVQITRLAQYGRDFLNMPTEGIDELIKALKFAALDGRHAERIIDTWTRQNRWMPTVADIYAMAEAVQDRPDPPDSRFQCKKCSGTGWSRIWTLATRRGDTMKLEIKPIPFETWEQLRHTVDGYHQRVDEGVTACDCEYGLHLAHCRYLQKQKDIEAGKGPQKETRSRKEKAS